MASIIGNFAPKKPFTNIAAQTFGNALMNADTAAAKWVSLGSSTANGGDADRDTGSPTNLTQRGYGWIWRLNQRLTTNVMPVFSDDSNVAAPGGGTPGLNFNNWTAPSTGVQLYNGAFGGQTSSTYLNPTRVANIIAIAPQLITHMIGSNDWSSSVDPAIYKSNVRGFIVSLISSLPNTVHVLFHQQERWDAGSRTYAWTQYGAKLKEIADEFPNNVVFYDLSKFFRPRGIPPTSSGEDLWSIVDDGDKMHLDNWGNKIMANIIADFLGLPLDTDIGPESFSTKTFTGTTIAANASATIASLSIPARPYYRAVEVKGAVFYTLTGGTDTTHYQGEIQPRLSGSVEAATNAWVEIALPRNTAPQAVTPQARYILPPNTAGTASFLAAAWQGNTWTISTSTGFNQLYVTTQPI